MKKFAPLILVLLFSFSINSGTRRSSNCENYKIDCAADFMKKRYKKNYNEFYIYETIEALSMALVQFFDIHSNKESFNQHVRRFYGFNIIISSKLLDKDSLKKDFERNKRRYRKACGNCITFDQFYELMCEIKKHYNVFCKKLVNQTQKRNCLSICRIFEQFKNSFSKNYFNRNSQLSTLKISAYKVVMIVRHRLGIKD